MAPGRRVVSVEPLHGGFRAQTVLLGLSDGARLVLRRAGARDTVALEVALLELLAGRVPVSEVVAADPTGAAAGEPVLVSRFVPGTLLERVLPGVSAADAGALGRAVGGALAAVGAVGFDRPGFLTVTPDGLATTGGGSLAQGLVAFVERCLASPSAVAALDPADRDRVRAAAAAAEPHLAPAREARRLVHADFNPRNLLVARRRGRWAVTAVLDWEFAYSGSPLADVGNLLRFPGDLPPAFAAAFPPGFADAGGVLPVGWRETAAALDLFSLADLLTRPQAHPMAVRVAALLRGTAARP